jgi:hypothetical protein
MSGGRPGGRSVRSSGAASAPLRTSAPSTNSKVSSRREPRPNGAPPPSPSPRRITPKHATSLAAIRTWRPRSSRAASTGPASAPKVRHECRGLGAAGTEASTGERQGRKGRQGLNESALFAVTPVIRGVRSAGTRGPGTMAVALGLHLQEPRGPRLKGGDYAQAFHLHGGRRGDWGGSRFRPNRRSQPAQRSKSRGHVPAGRQLCAGAGVVQPGRPGSITSRLERVHRKHRAPE